MTTYYQQHKDAINEKRRLYRKKMRSLFDKDLNMLDWGKAKKYSSNGYVNLYICISGTQVTKPEHCYIWEKHNGVIPEGFHVHHINKDRSDNRIENLQLLPIKHHARLHTGFILIDNDFYKSCVACGVVKKLSDNFYRCLKTYQSTCKDCNKKRVHAYQESHKKEISARVKEYAKTYSKFNKDIINEKHRKWRSQRKEEAVSE